MRRVRRMCSNCGHRHTVYEVGKEVLDELERDAALLKQMRILLDVQDRVVSIQCNSCTYWSNDGCTMDFPEAGGEFAGECSVYTPQG